MANNFMEDTYYILAINPGSTSTKVALFKNDVMVAKESIEHTTQDLAPYDNILSQYPFRRQCILDFLAKQGVPTHMLACVVGRGGLLPPIKTGGYRVNEKMKALIFSGQLLPHASNLGAVLADEIAAMAGKPAYIYDAVSANDITPMAQITGMPEITRTSLCHVLNSRAVARRVAKSMDTEYEQFQAVVAHLGGGISISVHQRGKIIDALPDDSGPFAPERAGGLPALKVIDLCFSGQYNRQEMIKKTRGNAGLVALVGTTDCREIERRIADGDEQVRLAYEAMVYNIAKGIGHMSVVLKGECEAIILTGGLAHSAYIIGKIKGYVSFLAPVVVVPGEFELEALAQGGLRIVKGLETAREFEY